ncbi:hypothetical protein QBC39DRAFT_272703 [Podospora conica]|nr:hypothetical protein QBC39DRAFT_272703 [Schizothecium conicum]
MSGFEIAGVVLGGVPIIVSALKLYVEGARTIQAWRRYAREVKSLIRSLETEQAKLQNVCERLLVNIVPETKIEDMINDPFGPLWREVATAKKIHARLWRSAKVFQDNVLDMNAAVEEMKKKLGLDPDGRPRWMGSPGVQKEFQRVLFVLRRSDYQDLIGRLRTGVSSLETLVLSNVHLEPDRHRRSRGRLCKIVRDAAMGVYHAVRGAITCHGTCPGPHDVGLRLTPQSLPITPDDDDEDVITSVKFRIAISYASTSMGIRGHQWGTASVRLWNHVALHPLKVEQKIATTRSHPGPDPERLRKPVRVSFASASTSNTCSAATTDIMATTVPTSLSQSDGIDMQWATTETAIPRKPANIGNLCQALRRFQKQLGTGESCGYVKDNNSPVFRRFDVLPLGGEDAESGIWSMVSLRDVLCGTGDDNRNSIIRSQHALTFRDRLHLAWKVASSVAQLHSTPWLANPPTHDDIFLARDNNNIILGKEAFVLKQFSNAAEPRVTSAATSATEAATTVLSASKTATSRNPELVALGVLLIELILGQPIDPLDDYQTLMPILDKVNTLGGSNYHSAVRRCIFSYDFSLGEMNGAGGDSDKMQQTAAFFDVITFLERDIGAVEYY